MRILAVLSILCVGNSAKAHLDLTAPTSRHGADVLKDGPCGQTGSTRTQNVTTFSPGETITVSWDEYVDHPGHFRIAFDADGDDDFVDPATMMEFDSNSSVLMDNIADTTGGTSSVQVTLPNVECDNCTLQVIQVMYDKPPYTTPGNDIYYQCADLVLTRGAVPDAGMPDATAPDSGSPDAGTTGGGGGCMVAFHRSLGATWPLMIVVGLILSRRHGR